MSQASKKIVFFKIHLYIWVEFISLYYGFKNNIFYFLCRYLCRRLQDISDSNARKISHDSDKCYWTGIIKEWTRGKIRSVLHVFTKQSLHARYCICHKCHNRRGFSQWLFSLIFPFLCMFFAPQRLWNLFLFSNYFSSSQICKNLARAQYTTTIYCNVDLARI